MLGFAKDDDFAGLDRYGRPRLRARFCFIPDSPDEMAFGQLCASILVSRSNF
jgi:hypothetical protein